MTQQRTRREVAVAEVASLKARGRIVVEIEGIEVGLYHHAGEFRAWRNLCPHQGGPACQGKFLPRTIQVEEADHRAAPGLASEDRVIVCPWHGYEYDVLTGRHVTNERVHLIAVPLRVEDGRILVTI